MTLHTQPLLCMHPDLSPSTGKHSSLAGRAPTSRSCSAVSNGAAQMPTDPVSHNTCKVQYCKPTLCTLYCRIMQKQLRCCMCNMPDAYRYCWRCRFHSFSIVTAAAPQRRRTTTQQTHLKRKAAAPCFLIIHLCLCQTTAQTSQQLHINIKLPSITHPAHRQPHAAQLFTAILHNISGTVLRQVGNAQQPTPPCTLFKCDTCYSHHGKRPELPSTQHAASAKSPLGRQQHQTPEPSDPFNTATPRTTGTAPVCKLILCRTSNTASGNQTAYVMQKYVTTLCGGVMRAAVPSHV
jgi:hypothetical protein